MKPTSQEVPMLYFLHGLGQNEQTLLRSGGLGLMKISGNNTKSAIF